MAAHRIILARTYLWFLDVVLRKHPSKLKSQFSLRQVEISRSQKKLSQSVKVELKLVFYLWRVESRKHWLGCLAFPVPEPPCRSMNHGCRHIKELPPTRQPDIITLNFNFKSIHHHICFLRFLSTLLSLAWSFSHYLQSCEDLGSFFPNEELFCVSGSPNLNIYLRRTAFVFNCWWNVEPGAGISFSTSKKDISGCERQEMFYIKVKLNEREFVLLIVRVIPSAKLLITMIQSPLPRSLLRNTRNDNYTDKHLKTTNITETQK